MVGDVDVHVRKRFPTLCQGTIIDNLRTKKLPASSSSVSSSSATQPNDEWLRIHARKALEDTKPLEILKLLESDVATGDAQDME